MKARVYTTAGRVLGMLELSAGVTVPDVLAAMRDHRLYFDRQPEGLPAAATALPADQLAAGAGVETNAPAAAVPGRRGR